MLSLDIDFLRRTRIVLSLRNSPPRPWCDGGFQLVRSPKIDAGTIRSSL